MRMLILRPSGNWIVRRFITSRREFAPPCGLPTRALLEPAELRPKLRETATLALVDGARRDARASLRREALGEAAVLREGLCILRPATAFLEGWFLISGCDGRSAEGAAEREAFSLSTA